MNFSKNSGSGTILGPGFICLILCILFICLCKLFNSFLTVAYQRFVVSEMETVPSRLHDSTLLAVVISTIL